MVDFILNIKPTSKKYVNIFVEIDKLEYRLNKANALSKL